MCIIQSTITIIFFSKDKDEDNDEERIMHSKCDNIEIMINNKTDEVSGKRYVSFRNRHENDLETLTKSFPIVFDYLHQLYYKSHKINSNRGGSYIDSLDWINILKATINPINKQSNK